MSAIVTIDIAAALDRAVARLHAAGVEQPRRDARLLLAEALGGGPEIVIGYPEQPLGPEEAAAFESLIGRRAAREPVSRILGRREFWSLSFGVTPDTFDPRPDSETLIEAVLSRIENRDAPWDILDLGTGTGCLLLALLSELPRARGLGIDLDAAAVTMARGNAERLGLAARARFRRGDWVEDLTGSWQVIVSNPPYIMESAIADLAPEVSRYDPRVALSGGADGLAAYRCLVPQVVNVLAPGGILALEVGTGQAKDVECLLGAVGLEGLGRRADLAGVERCILATKLSAGSADEIGRGKKKSWNAVRSRLGWGSEPEAPASFEGASSTPDRVCG